jgi:hypothetical protein
MRLEASLVGLIAKQQALGDLCILPLHEVDVGDTVPVLLQNRELLQASGGEACSRTHTASGRGVSNIHAGSELQVIRKANFSRLLDDAWY